MRTICTIVVLVLIAMASSILSLVSFWLTPVCFLALTSLFVKNALKKIPADPPHKAILIFLGKRQETVLDEGWNWIPLNPFVFDMVLIKVEKIVQDLGEQIVRTPDLAEIGAKVSLTWLPGSEKKDYAKSLINYLNTGGEAGVRKNLDDVIEGRLRTWAASNQEGPSDWVEAMASKDEALEVLLKAILGDSLPKVDSDIPTTAWMKFFSRPKRKPSQKEIEMGWSPENPTSPSQLWEGLQTELGRLSPDEQKELTRQVRDRMEAVREIKEGRGTFSQEALGITILRFTVNEIAVQGKTATAAEKDATEKRETVAETRELEHVSRRIQELTKNNPEISIETAIRTIQIERGKISKSVIEVLGASTGLGQDVLAALGVQRMSGGKPASGPDSSGKKGGGQQGGQGGNPADSYAESAEKIFQQTGKYPTWDPKKRTPN